jgi:K+-sensing histidine kinase KdpD
VGNRAAEYRRTQGLEQAPIPEKVMVCLSTRPGTERLLRVGARIAGRLASNWYAVYVTRPTTRATATPKPFTGSKSISAWPATWARRWFRSPTATSPTR